jgi:hypothetical protein
MESNRGTIAILTRYGIAGVELLKNLLRPLRATGKTERSIGYKVTATEKYTKLVIFGREFFQTIESGRGPRKSSTYGGFDKGLEDYLKAKAIQTKQTKSGKTYYKLGNSWMTPKSLAYLINKEGDRTYREGGREVYSDDLSKLFRELKAAAIEDFKGNFKTEIKKYFKNANSSQTA